MLKQFTSYTDGFYWYSLLDDKLNSIIELNTKKNDDGTFTIVMSICENSNLTTFTIGKVGKKDVIK